MPCQTQLKNLLRLEVAHKSTTSAVAFLVFSAFIFFYAFNCVTYAPYIRASMVLVFGVSIFRLILVKKIAKKKSITEVEWKRIVTYIWLNSLGWSLAVNLASFELKLSGIHFIVVTTMLAGFVAASLFTLAYDHSIFLPFQFLMLTPQVGIILYYYYGPEKIDAIALIPIYLMYLVYQLRQYKDFKEQTTLRLSYQLDLERSNEDLLKSKNALVEQTMKLIHTSRLAALGEMSAGIAHEVNNPLAIISGSIQQIERLSTRGEKDPERLFLLTRKSQQAVERVTKIVNGLRQFSQQSDAIPKTHTTLKEIIHDTVSFCGELLVARYIKLNIDHIPEVTIECNPVQISQVLINLIKNAEDALETETNQDERWIHISFVENEMGTLILVRNGGNLIPRDIHNKLFQPFFTTKVVGKGTGLGLSISQGIMREHEGDLIFDQTADKTTFALQLPSLFTAKA